MNSMAVACVGHMVLHVDAERNDKGKDDKRAEHQPSPTLPFLSQSHHQFLESLPRNLCKAMPRYKRIQGTTLQRGFARGSVGATVAQNRNMTSAARCVVERAVRNSTIIHYDGLLRLGYIEKSTASFDHE